MFGKVWLLVCHETELRDIHDFRTIDLVGTPLILVRGNDKRIRCFLNACSHRGAKIVSARKGNARTLTCPFHLWAYETTGRCTSITRPDASLAGGCKKEDLGLREIRAEVRKGLVFYQ
ncbi:MAG: Rieske (2Fe-2S) protein [Betaproteobacteria bacterium]|nr:Rieske (2Fe-2S) protein [Betaproteobacteria bacterium]